MGFTRCIVSHRLDEVYDLLDVRGDLTKLGEDLVKLWPLYESRASIGDQMLVILTIST